MKQFFTFLLLSFSKCNLVGSQVYGDEGLVTISPAETDLYQKCKDLNCKYGQECVLDSNRLGCGSPNGAVCNCKSWQLCILRVVWCIRAPCPPIPECADPPCVLPCPFQYRCEITDNGPSCVPPSTGVPLPGKTTPTAITCANVRCAGVPCVDTPNGPVCQSGGTTAEEYNPCAATTCLTGSDCIVVDGTAHCVPPGTTAADFKKNNTCPKGETLSGCGNLCEGKCKNAGKGPIACPLICLPAACACNPDLYRNDEGKCVPISECPNTCPENEVINQCGNLCEPDCDNAISGKPKICIKICAPAACVCKDGLYRSPGGECVSKEACTTTGYDG